MTTPDYVAALQFELRAVGLPLGEREYRFHPSRRWRFDVAWPDQMVALEIDGGTWIYGRHSTGTGFERDSEKMSEAAVLGWRVLRVTPAMIRSGMALGFVERILRPSGLKDTRAPERHYCRWSSGCPTIITGSYDLCQFHRRERREQESSDGVE